MSVRQLRVEWQETFGKLPQTGLTKDMLARILTHRMQEKVLGGLNREMKVHLAKFSSGNAESIGPLKSGSLIVREYEGVMHQVVIVPDGYLWNGNTFSSLSAIALKITGTNWNGPRFFGLRGGTTGSTVEPTGRNTEASTRVSNRASP